MAGKGKTSLTSRYFVNPYGNNPDEQKTAVNAGKVTPVILNLVRKALAAIGSKDFDLDGGIYVGPSGVAYMLLHVIRSGKVILSPLDTSVFFESGLKALETHIQHYQNLVPKK